jgi:hypothetical protein
MGVTVWDAGKVGGAGLVPITRYATHAEREEVVTSNNWPGSLAST